MHGERVYQLVGNDDADEAARNETFAERRRPARGFRWNVESGER